MAGNTFGRVLGIIGGSLGAIGALLSVGGSYRGGRSASSSVRVVVHGIIIYGGGREARANLS